MIEVQCSSCHTRYRIDEQVLPEGTPTFKCSRCGHVFSLEPRRQSAPEKKPAPATPSRFAARTSPAAEARERSTPTAPPQPPKPTSSSNGSAVAVKPEPNEAAPDQAVPAVTEPAAEAQSATAELGARPLKSEPPAPEDGENLAFDFRDEPGPLQEGAEAPPPPKPEPPPPPVEPRWEVGDDATAPARLKRRTRFRIGAEDFPDDKVAAPEPPDAAALDDDLLDESAAPVYNRGVVHSSRFVLALLLFTALGFAMLTLAIHNAPAAALEALNRIPILGARFPVPSAPARMVVLQDVHAGYERARDGAQDLVIRGNAENVSSSTLGAVKIGAELRPSNLAQREVYCGNNLEPRTLAQMTSHEVEFFQKLAPRNFRLDPSASCPFIVVFADAPANARNFDLAVTQATPAQNSDASPLTEQSPASTDEEGAP